MLHRKQRDYDKFKCIANKCPMSCCVGWQIAIDDDSIKTYHSTVGKFGNRLQASIDYNEKCFLQNSGRCSMLNKSGLCDLQSTLGEDYLCETCRLFPRHIEEFQDIREYSLSLSCPEVVRMVLTNNYDFGISESEDDIIDSPDDFEDFDFLLFDKLEYARDNLLAVASDKSLLLQERLSRIATAALALQACFDYGDIFSMDEVSYDSSHEDLSLSFDYCLKSMDVLIDMEFINDSWNKSVRASKQFWSAKDDTSTEWSHAMYPNADLEFAFEKILKSLLFTYFCGAVYDGQIYARTMIAVQSTRWLMMLYYSNNDTSLEVTTYLYSKEVEHSDVNINLLIEYFEKEL